MAQAAGELRSHEDFGFWACPGWGVTCLLPCPQTEWADLTQEGTVHPQVIFKPQIYQVKSWPEGWPFATGEAFYLDLFGRFFHIFTISMVGYPGKKIVKLCGGQPARVRLGGEVGATVLRPGSQ